jgi:hypothetical protein
MAFLLWFDDDSKRPTAQKIAQAVEAYQERFKTAPSVVLVNEGDLCDVPGVEVRSEGYIRRNNFWVGMVEGTR